MRSLCLCIWNKLRQGTRVVAVSTWAGEGSCESCWYSIERQRTGGGLAA